MCVLALNSKERRAVMSVNRFRVINDAIALLCIEEDKREEHFFGILDQELYNKDGTVRVVAQGGGQRLGRRESKVLARIFNVDAKDFEPDRTSPGRLEACFRAGEEHLEGIVDYFRMPRKKEMKREGKEELVGRELKGVRPVLTAEEFSSINIVHLGYAVQPLREGGYADSRHKDEHGRGIVTRNLIHYWQYVVTRRVLEKMRESAAIQFLTAEDLETTRSGSRLGWSAEDYELGDNLYLPYFMLPPEHA